MFIESYLKSTIIFDENLDIFQIVVGLFWKTRILGSLWNIISKSEFKVQTAYNKRAYNKNIGNLLRLGEFLNF